MSGDYSMALIRRLLAGYAALEEGRLPVQESGYADYWGPKMTKRQSAMSPFENAVIRKSDIDRAIQELPPSFKFVVLAVDIDGREIQDCAYWLGKSVSEIMHIEDKAVKRIAGILSGQTDFRGGERDGAGRKSKAKKSKGTF